MSNTDVDAGAIEKVDTPADTGKTPAAVVKDTGKDGGHRVAPAAKPAATLAAGAETPAPEKPVYFADNWREEIARRKGGEDEKAVAKELKRLQRYTSPEAIWDKATELEGKLSAGGLIKVPGPKATDEEKATYYKAIGVPEKPEEYFDKIKLSNNRVLGDADKPAVESFVKALHPKGATPEIISAATDWFLDYQTGVAAEREEADGEYRQASEAEVKKQWGGSYAGNVKAIGALFDSTTGGGDVRDLLLNGRDAEGKKLGDNPVVLNFLANLGLDHFPQSTVVTSTGASTGDRLAEIRKFAREHPAEYDQDKAMQAEQTAIIEAQQRSSKRGNKAA